MEISQNYNGMPQGSPTVCMFNIKSGLSFQVNSVRPSLFLEAAYASNDSLHVAAVLRFFSDFTPDFKSTSEYNRYICILGEMQSPARARGPLRRKWAVSLFLEKLFLVLRLSQVQCNVIFLGDTWRCRNTQGKARQGKFSLSSLHTDLSTLNSWISSFCLCKIVSHLIYTPSTLLLSKTDVYLFSRWDVKRKHYSLLSFSCEN